MKQHNDIQYNHNLFNVNTLSVAYVVAYVECHCAESRYTENRDAFAMPINSLYVQMLYQIK